MLFMIPFLWLLRVSQDKAGFLSLFFVWFFNASFEFLLGLELFVILAVRFQSVDEGLEQELPQKVEVSGFEGLKALCTSQPSSPVLFSNLIGLDFMAERLWLLFCLLSTLNS